MSQPLPSWACHEDENIYHQRSRTGETISAGMLREYRLCPAFYQQLVTGVSKRTDTDSWRFGRAAHAAILEGEQGLLKKFAIGGPVNPKTNKPYAIGTQAHNAWMEENGSRHVHAINAEEYARIRLMAESVRKHQSAASLLRNGFPEIVITSEHQRLPCQARLDWWNPDCGIVELKTCDDISWFESDARKFEYFHQLAFYRDVVATASGLLPAVHVIAVEKKNPFNCGVWSAPEYLLDFFSEINRKCLADLRESRSSNNWPTGYEEVREFNFGRVAI